MKFFAIAIAVGLWTGSMQMLAAQGLPIKPTRTVSFTTTEGSNMSIDVSPDGKTLVFDLLGDLYTLPVTGGTAKQITRGMAINIRPVWSPDGTKIAYISDYSGALHLNVRNLPGTYHQIFDKNLDTDLDILLYGNYFPIWTPNGNSINFGKSIYSFTGSEVPIQQGVKYFGYSEDGQSLYFSDSAGINRYDKANHQRNTLFEFLGGYSSQVSPDGRWHVYIVDSNFQKCLLAHDRIKNSTRILVPSFRTVYPFYENFVKTHYAFSPGSKNLYVGYGGKIHRINLEDGNDQVIPFTAHVNVDMGHLQHHSYSISQDSMRVGYTRSANASPDGRHLVFSALNNLYVMDLPHGKPRLLVEQPLTNQYQPIYSPDGHWIAYVSWNDSADGHLWRIPANGGTPSRMTDIPGQYQRPAWSPDGKSIAVIRGKAELDDRSSPGSGYLELINVENRQFSIIDTVPLWNQLSFSPDGRKIIYQPAAKTGLNLVSKDLLENYSQVINTGWPELHFNLNYVQQRSLSPDGKFIVFTMGEELYLTAVEGLPDMIVDNKARLQHPSIIRFATGVDPHWEKGGEVISWSYGNHYYRISLDTILTQAHAPGYFTLTGRNITRVTPKPEQEIAIDIQVATPHSEGIIAFKRARIITMRENEVIEDGTIIAKNGRIQAVGPSSAVTIPPGARIFDVAGCTIMPGMVDLHLHFQLPRNIFPGQSWKFITSLAYGVTTARDPSDSYDAFGYAELLRSGKMVGPRLFSAGRSVTDFPEAGVKVDNFEEARTIALQHAQVGGTFLKQYMLPTRRQHQWLLLAGEHYGLNMTNEGDFPWVGQLAMMKDGSTGIEHTPEWGDVFDDVIKVTAASGTCLTPTLQQRYGDGLTRGYANAVYWNRADAKMQRFIRDVYLRSILKPELPDTAHNGFTYPSEICARIRHAGGSVAMGSHGDLLGVGIHNELWALQMGGLTTMETLQAATIIGARGLGMQQDIGSLEPGKIADLLVLTKNPLEDIHNSREIKYVMKDGILYDASTMDTIWPYYKPCPVFNRIR